jgi:hypothetical protein
MTHPEPTTWTIHLARRRPGLTAAVLLVLFFGLVAVQATFGSWVLTVLATVLIIGNIAEFLFPVTYRLDARGASARQFFSYRILPWAQVRRVYLSPNGIKLSPLAARSWAETYRGVELRTPDRESVLAQVRAWLEAEGVTPRFSED